MRSVIGSVPLPLILGGEFKGLRPVTSLWFADNHRIVATFVIHDGVADPKLSRRRSADSPLQLRAIFIDTATSNIAATANWPTDSRQARIVDVYNGKLVVQTGNEVALYDPDLKVMNTLILETLNTNSIYDWWSGASPTGKSLVFSSATEETVQYRWVDAGTLRVVKSWQDTPGSATIADDKLARVTSCVVYNCTERFQIRSLSTDWSTTELNPRYLFDLRFVNNDLLFFRSGYPNPSPKLMGSDGRTVPLKEKPCSGCFWWAAIPSAQGKRFVVLGMRAKGSHPALDLGGHTLFKELLVYELSPQEWPEVIEVNGPPINDIVPDEVALSPDGSRLAILNNQTVHMFDLPPVH